MAMYNEITVTAELTNTEYMITKNYNLLQNKPQINSVELMGNKSLEDLGINPDAEENVIDVVKVNGSALTPDENKAVNVTVTTGSDNGTVKVNGSDVAVKGLKSAAFTEATAYDAAGSAAEVQGNVDELTVVVNGKVDKVQGKGLSQNDFTNAYKTKLDGIEAGAQVNTVTSVAGKTGAVILSKSDVGLGNVDNTSDLDKPISTATQTALNAKADTSAVNAALENKANVDGNYEDLSVGQLLADTYEVEKVPYIFRTSGGALKVGDREYDTLVGGTVAFNQLVKNGNFADGTTNWVRYDTSKCTFSVSNNVMSVTYTASGSGGYAYGIKQNIVEKFDTTHLYLLSCDAKADFTTNLSAEFAGSLTVKQALSNTWTRVNLLSKGKGTTKELIVKPTQSTIIEGSVLELRNVYLVDLTAMFGSTIADYVNTLEQATAGSGVAYFRSLFPKDYYAYNAGQLMSVKALSHKMVGFNQWDEEWELGAFDNNGNKTTSTSRFRSKNPIRVIPDTTYYVYSGSNKYIYMYFYDAMGNFIRNNNKRNETFVTPTNAYTLLFCVGTEYGSTYNNDICINLHWDGERDGEYEAYEEHIYPLDSDLELRGIPKLDANNNLYYDGDTYESDGTVTRKYGFRAYQSGDESLADAITDGTNTVYKLTTPTTETADTFENPQLVDNWGTEEYTDSREVQIPVGHITKYPPDLKAKLENMPSIPKAPTTNGTYVLKAVVSGGVATYSWVSE